VSILWLDDYAVRRPVNKVYFPLSQPVKRFFKSTLTWLGDLVCAAAIPAMLIVGVWFWVSIVALVRGL
jgi:hypothetical protein